MAAIAAGIPPTACMQTLNRQCASGLQAVATIVNSIEKKEITIGIGAGVESMSFFPMHKMSLFENSVDWDAMNKNMEAMDCLLPMGVTSDTVARKYNLERHELDAFAASSHQKAAKAQASGKFQAEIVPVRGVSQDDGIRANTNLAVLSKLKAVFTPTGLTTAGNSSQTTDGAAAILLMTRSEAMRRGLRILAVWRGFAIKGVPPSIMGVGPAYAIPAVLEQVGISVADLGVVELNEAFATQALWCIRELGLDPAVVNPSGGAIALGK